MNNSTSFKNLLERIKIVYANSCDEISQDNEISELIRLHLVEYGIDFPIPPMYHIILPSVSPLLYIRQICKNYNYVYRLLGSFAKNGCVVTSSDIYSIAFDHLGDAIPVHSLISVFKCIDKTVLCKVINMLIVEMFTQAYVSPIMYAVLLAILHVAYIIDRDFEIYPETVERYIAYHTMREYEYNISALSEKIIPKILWKESFIDDIKSNNCAERISIDIWIKL